MRKNYNSSNDNQDADKDDALVDSNISKNNPRRFSLPKRKPKQDIINLDNVRSQSVKYKKEKTRVELIPRNTAQEDYVDALSDYDTRVTFSMGPAGTGKTLLAVLRAIQALKRQEVTRIVITRPAVGVEGENHGFLPGDLNAKMEPWLLPVLDILYEYWTPSEVSGMMVDKIIEVSPLMYMRGRTFKDCFIIADEMQNSTPEQMKMLLTRIGVGTTMVVTGDLDQTDHKKCNGLQDIANRLKDTKTKGIAICEFEDKHIERDPIVKQVLALYK